MVSTDTLVMIGAGFGVSTAGYLLWAHQQIRQVPKMQKKLDTVNRLALRILLKVDPVAAQEELRQTGALFEEGV